MYSWCLSLWCTSFDLIGSVHLQLVILFKRESESEYLNRHGLAAETFIKREKKLVIPMLYTFSCCNAFSCCTHFVDTSLFIL